MRHLLAAALFLGATPLAAEPLLVHDGRLFIAAKVNGVATEALLDSGAEASIIDPALAAEAHLPEGQQVTIRGSGGSTVARFVEGAPIEALGATMKGEGIVVLDLDDLSQRLIKRPTRAIVGRELFDAERLAIDISGGRIERAPRDATPQGIRLPLTAHAGIESIPVKANRVAAQAEFDLGNGGAVLISRALANRLGLRIVDRTSGGGIGGEVIRDRVKLKRLIVAGRTFRTVPAEIDDQPSANDLNIGTSILRHFLITTDFKQRAVWLAPLDGLHAQK